MVKLIVAVALLLGATTAGFAQSQRNFGPNGPDRSNCYGQPYSGSVSARCGGHWYHHYYHRY